VCLSYCILAAVIALITVPAHATFPGKNGRIAFVQGPDIYTMNQDGSNVRQLTALTDGGAFWVNWSPDGKQIVFSRFAAPDFFGQLWLMNADGGNQHLLLTDPGFDDEAASFSPDGSHLIFSRCAPLDGEFPCAIYRVGLDGSGISQVTPVRIELTDLEPVYSPDGSTIAFDSFGRDGILGAVHLMNSDGTNIRQLTLAQLGGYGSDWSPDGEQLVFTTKCCNPELANIAVIRRDGKQVRQVTDDKGVFGAGRSSWSPQGDAIVFRTTNVTTGEGGIYVSNADGSNAKLILKVRPSTVPNNALKILKKSHFLKNKHELPASTQIEDGGALPRWGTAQ
jgi:TolB protein